MRASYRSVLTFDLHAGDSAAELIQCLEILDREQLKATFFIPTSLLSAPQLVPAFRALAETRHELGTHGHEHDASEREALGSGSRPALGFLQQSTDEFGEFFGYQPRVFRSPAWSFMGSAAIDELERLGYQVDSSATPQRLGILSSEPWRNPYLVASRRPALIRPGLLEVPTSAFLVPLAAPTFQTLRRTASLAFTRMLILETRLFASRVVVAQFHVHDLIASRVIVGWSDRRWSQLVPSRHGIVARYWIRMTDAPAIARLSLEVMKELQKGEIVSFGEVFHRFMGEEARTAPADGRVTTDQTPSSLTSKRDNAFPPASRLPPPT